MRSLSVEIAVTIFCATLSLPSAQAADADDWFDFRSDSGRFRIGFPGELPATRALPVEKFTVTTNNISHEVTVEQTEFSVELHDIPRIAAMLLSQDFILDRAKEGMLADIGAHELSSREVSRQRYPARQVRYEMPDRGLVGESLLVLARQRLYLVSSQHPAKREPPVPFSAFLDGFEFWPE